MLFTHEMNSIIIINQSMISRPMNILDISTSILASSKISVPIAKIFVFQCVKNGLHHSRLSIMFSTQLPIAVKTTSIL